jgi:sec-independent protein translocase protein TatA
MIAAIFDSPAEIGIVLLVVLLLFGGAQLPKLAKNIGKAQKEFKDGLSEGQKGKTEEEKKAAEIKAAEARLAELKGETPVVPHTTEL